MTETPQASNRLHLAHKDMEDVKRFLDALRGLDDLQKAKGTSEYFDHCEAILIAAMVTYCRPFKSSRSGGLADKSLEASSLVCLSTHPNLRALHDLIEYRRDKAIAHGDWVMRSTEVLPIADGTAIFRRTPIPDLVSGVAIQEFWDLAHSISVECLHRSYTIDRRAQGGGAA